jgi:hypothetical protein
VSFDAPLARLAADRHAERRAESGLIQSLLQRPSTRIVPVARGLVPTLHTDDAGPPRLAFLTPGEARLEGTELYLGSFGGIDYVGLVIEEDRPPALDGRPAATPDPSRPVLPALGEARWVSVREIEAQLSDLEVGLVMSATALAALLNCASRAS